MKRINLFLVTIFIFLFATHNTYAMTLKPSSEGITKVKTGENLIVYIKLERNVNEKTISAIDGMFGYDKEVFELVDSIVLLDSWEQISVINNKKFGFANFLFNNLITNMEENIAKIIFKVKNNANYGDTILSINNPSATDSEGNGVEIYGSSTSIKILSNVNDLTNIKLSNGTIDFNKDSVFYKINVNNEINNIDVDAILKDNKSSFVSGYGPRNVKLNVGENIVELKVMSESGIVKIYALNIIRKESINNNPSNDNVDNSNNNSSNGNIDNSNNNQVVENEKSNNNYLNNIKSDKFNLEFDRNIEVYQVTVPYDVESIGFEYENDDSKSVVEMVGNENLKVGNNDIIFTVTAEDGSVREYKIIVTRKEENEAVSNNSKLRDLMVSGYSLNFDSNKYDYILKIKDEKKLDILYTKDDIGSSVKIEGNENLVNNSIITITVTAEDQTTSTYKIKVKKDNNIYLIIGIISLLTIALIVVYLIFRNKKKKIN